MAGAKQIPAAFNVRKQRFPDKMRVLIFSQQLAAFRSGVGTFARGVVDGLVQRGHRITVVVPEKELIRLPGSRLISVTPFHGDPTPGYWMSLGVRFAEVLRREAGEHDIAFFTDAREAWHTAPAGIPTAGMVNDAYALDWIAPDYPRKGYADCWVRGFYYQIARKFEARAYRRLSALVANSRYVCRKIVNGYRLAPDSVQVVYLGLPDFPPRQRQPLKGNPAVLFAGGNFQRKGLTTLLEAAARLKFRFPDIHVHVVGKDRNQRRLAAQARALRIGDAVTFHGRQPNDRLRAMMAAADLFALPADTEAYGLVYLEAMQSGVPVIATASGGLREVIDDGKDALFVPPRDPAAVAAAVEAVASDPQVSSRLGREGRKKAEGFTQASMVDAIEAFLGRWCAASRRA